MTGAVIPFRSAAQCQADEALAAIQAQTIRETRRKIFECRQIRAEAERVRRCYLERQARIEVLLHRISADVEGEGG